MRWRIRASAFRDGESMDPARVTLKLCAGLGPLGMMVNLFFLCGLFL